jgi:hypothetical protein
MFQYHIPVGHPRQIITDRTMAASFPRAFPRPFANLFWVFQVKFEQLLQHANCTLIRLMHGRVVIKVFVKKRSELQIKLSGREQNETAGGTK